MFLIFVVALGNDFSDLVAQCFVFFLLLAISCAMQRRKICVISYYLVCVMQRCNILSAFIMLLTPAKLFFTVVVM